MKTRVAGFDIGTNSIRILVADAASADRVVPCLRLGFATRLGEGLSSTGRISEEALTRTCRVLEKSARLARALGVSKMVAGATYAVRVASNSDEVVGRLEAVLSIPVKVLAAEEEARLAYAGAFSDEESWPPIGLVIDAGGGSTTLTRGEGTKIVNSVTLPFGCVNLTERFLRLASIEEARAEASDRTAGRGMAPLEGTRPEPARPQASHRTAAAESAAPETARPAEALGALRAYITSELNRSNLEPFSFPALSEAWVEGGADKTGDAVFSVKGVGGAITSIAAVSLGLPFYKSRRVEGHILSLEEMERCAIELARLPLEEREKIGGLGRKRAEIAVAGAVLVSLLVQRLGLKHILVSTRGLRFALAIEAARQAFH